MKVIGVDAALGGWIAVILAEEQYLDARVFIDFEELVNRVDDVAVIGVDVPIGLPQEGRRQADIDARAFVGVRRSSVFWTPPRGVFDEANYAAVRARYSGISSQSWALRRAILDVERFEGDPRVHEVHPEVSFRAVAGQELPFPKRSWNGLQLRLKLLHEAGIELPPELDIGRVPADDVIDAAVVAWTARRIARGEAESLPPGHEDRIGAIWY